MALPAVGWLRNKPGRVFVDSKKVHASPAMARRGAKERACRGPGRSPKVHASPAMAGRGAKERACRGPGRSPKVHASPAMAGRGAKERACRGPVGLPKPHATRPGVAWTGDEAIFTVPRFSLISLGCIRQRASNRPAESFALEGQRLATRRRYLGLSVFTLLRYAAADRACPRADCPTDNAIPYATAPG